MIVKPSDIIYHIIGVELDNPDLAVDSKGLADARNAHPDWQMGFTVNKKINSKKLIEGIAKESRLFPFFKGDKLSFNSIKETYDETDVDPENERGFTIKDSDVISYKFDRTKIEDVKTKVILNYHYDYATDDFTKSTKSLNIPQTAFELFEDEDDETPPYENSYYGIEGEQGDDPIEVKYIRHDDSVPDSEQTISKLQRFLLAWYCQQHNLCSVKLPLSYLYAEVGDVVAFPELLNGRKAYGEDYSLESFFASGVISRNGQEILPYWMVTATSKSLDSITLDLIQLHNLSYSSINLPPTAYIEGQTEALHEEVFTLLGSGQDPEGQALSYHWYTTPGVYYDNNSSQDQTLSLSLSPVEDERTFNFLMKVNDGEHYSNYAEHFITVYRDLSNVMNWDVNDDGFLNVWNINPVSPHAVEIDVTSPPGQGQPGWLTSPGFRVALTGGIDFHITQHFQQYGQTTPWNDPTYYNLEMEEGELEFHDVGEYEGWIGYGDYWTGTGDTTFIVNFNGLTTLPGVEWYKVIKIFEGHDLSEDSVLIVEIQMHFYPGEF